jgi:ubiquinone/menaquinone biosynthesis C-methylase UbiE
MSKLISPKIDYNPMRKHRYASLMSYLSNIGGPRGGVVVDCACGLGKGAAVLQGLGYEVLAFDIDPVRVQESIGRGIETAQVGDLTQLPVGSETADIFVCSETLEHLTSSQYKQAVSEILRITKKGGFICVTVPEVWEDNVPGHKILVTRDMLVNSFDGCSVRYHGVLHKNREASGNLVMIFKKN